MLMVLVVVLVVLVVVVVVVWLELVRKESVGRRTADGRRRTARLLFHR